MRQHRRQSAKCVKVISGAIPGEAGGRYKPWDYFLKIDKLYSRANSKCVNEVSQSSGGRFRVAARHKEHVWHIPKMKQQSQVKVYKETNTTELCGGCQLVIRKSVCFFWLFVSLRGYTSTVVSASFAKKNLQRCGDLMLSICLFFPAASCAPANSMLGSQPCSCRLVSSMLTHWADFS